MVVLIPFQRLHKQVIIHTSLPWEQTAVSGIVVVNMDIAQTISHHIQVGRPMLAGTVGLLDIQRVAQFGDMFGQQPQIFWVTGFTPCDVLLRQRNPLLLRHIA